MSATEPYHADHMAWMGLALDEARLALKTDDVPIGAVVLGPDGGVLGSGRNEREAHGDPTAHAEVVAIRQAAASLRLRAQAMGGSGDGWRLEDCTLVVTLEPCAMCAGAIVLARIPRVVFGTADPKAGAAGSVLDPPPEPRLNPRPHGTGGVLAPECAALLVDFFTARRR